MMNKGWLEGSLLGIPGMFRGWVEGGGLGPDLVEGCFRFLVRNNRPHPRHLQTIRT